MSRIDFYVPMRCATFLSVDRVAISEKIGTLLVYKTEGIKKVSGGVIA